MKEHSARLLLGEEGEESFTGEHVALTGVARMMGGSDLEDRLGDGTSRAARRSQLVRDSLDGAPAS